MNRGTDDLHASAQIDRADHHVGSLPPRYCGPWPPFRCVDVLETKREDLTVGLNSRSECARSKFLLGLASPQPASAAIPAIK